MNIKAVVTFLTLTTVIAKPGHYNNNGNGHAEIDNGHENGDHDYDSGSYEFKYAIKHSSEELDFGHSETKDDEGVKGYYYVLLPDSRMQKVTYYVDGDSGYVAEVTYSGEAEFDENESEGSHSQEGYSYGRQ